MFFQLMKNNHFVLTIGSEEFDGDLSAQAPISPEGFGQATKTLPLAEQFRWQRLNG